MVVEGVEAASVTADFCAARAAAIFSIRRLHTLTGVLVGGIDVTDSVGSGVDKGSGSFRIFAVGADDDEDDDRFCAFRARSAYESFCAIQTKFLIIKKPRRVMVVDKAENGKRQPSFRVYCPFPTLIYVLSLST